MRKKKRSRGRGEGGGRRGEGKLFDTQTVSHRFRQLSETQAAFSSYRVLNCYRGSDERVLISSFGIRFRSVIRELPISARRSLLVKHRLLIIAIYVFNISCTVVLNNEISRAGGGKVARVSRRDGNGVGRARARETTRVRNNGRDKLVPCVFAQPRRIMYTARR